MARWGRRMVEAGIKVSSTLAVASKKMRTTLGHFVRWKSLEAVEMDTLNRHVVIIPAADWTKFEAWINAPAKNKSALRKLAQSRPAWRD